MAKIGIIGSGFVGQSIGKGFIKLGHHVVFYDVANKDVPNFTKDIDALVQNTDVSFVCVPTPSVNGRIDLSYIRDATEKCGKSLALRKKYYVLVIKSTVVPTTTEKVVIPILQKHKKLGQELGVCMNPEFLTQIASNWTTDNQYLRDFFGEDKVVIGEYDKKSGDVLEEIYSPLRKPVFRTDLKTAEIIKYASNCMLATKISYWNEIFLVCKNLGVNSQTVADIVALDPRIGKYGTVHGKAFGGTCLPKDLKAFLAFAKEYHEAPLLQAVDRINEEMKKDYGVRE